MQGIINSQITSVEKYPIQNFSYTVDPQFEGPSVLEVNLMWSYTVPRLGWPLMQYSRSYLIILEHASDGSVVSLNQSGQVVPKSQYIPFP